MIGARLCNGAFVEIGEAYEVAMIETKPITGKMVLAIIVAQRGGGATGKGKERRG